MCWPTHGAKHLPAHAEHMILVTLGRRESSHAGAATCAIRCAWCLAAIRERHRDAKSQRHRETERQRQRDVRKILRGFSIRKKFEKQMC